MDFLEYYSNINVQKQIANASKDKEVGLKYGEQGYGKRPDIIQFESDVFEVVKQGVTSFHISEEHWRDPLQLKPGMTKKQLDDLRIGWDLIIDIDSPNLEYSKITAELIVEALKFHDIKNISVKYSGNKGFHIGVPFNAFPDKVNELRTKDLFPEGLRVIANYLSMFIKPYLEKKIENEKLNIQLKDLLTIDNVLISSRHMYRAPYSVHEKSGLASIVINPEEIKTFNKEQAKLENVKADKAFLDYDKTERNEAERLIIQAFDWESKIRNRKEEKDELEKTNNVTKKYDEFTEEISEEHFPPCIKLGLKGLEDGKKRFLFILLNFLRNMNWSYEKIQERVLEWNKINPQPLKDGYILSQVSWHKRQGSKVLPPNCPTPNTTLNYYKDLHICHPDNLCNMIKNPVQYSIRKSKFKNQDK